MLVTEQYSLSLESDTGQEDGSSHPCLFDITNFLLHSVRDPAEIPHLHSFMNIARELTAVQIICCNRSCAVDFRFTCVCQNRALKMGAAIFIARKQCLCGRSRLKCAKTVPA